uniref:Microtubule-associated protein 1B/S N-terminal domain-containing protein n=1 Tax=Anser cygnoides TaxID=8845 RepID=A0A8B9E0B8_ANSCY
PAGVGDAGTAPAPRPRDQGYMGRGSGKTGRGSGWIWGDRIRSWDIDLASCNLDEQLKLFVSRHSATFSSIGLSWVFPRSWGRRVSGQGGE